MPKSITNDSEFLIDLNLFKLETALADDNGSYSSYGNKTGYYEIQTEEENSNFINVNYRYLGEKLKKNWKSKVDVYRIIRINYKCKSNKNFVRKTMRITKIDNQSEFDKIIFVYSWNSKVPLKERVFDLIPHGNAKKNISPYYRLDDKTKESIKNESLKAGSSSQKYNKLIKNMGKNSFSKIPRSTRQFNYYKKYYSDSKNKTKTHDEIFDALLNREDS